MFLEPTNRTRPVIRVGLAVFAFAASLALVPPSPGAAASLRGSEASVRRQDHEADLHDFTRLRTPAQVRKFVSLGLLVPVPGNRDYELEGVSHGVARPEVKLFVERLAAQYHAATGEKLVVTSLTRPISEQPRNASELSVHPAGMAVDIRKSRSHAARRWLERVLLSLEKAGVLEATRERHPPHYHVAVFPEPYAGYVQRIGAEAPSDQVHRVRRGENLWEIARHYGSSVKGIKDANNMASARIYPGQTLRIPPSR